MAMSNFLEDTILEMVLNSVAYSEPASVYIALFDADPTDANLTANEITGATAYERVQVTAGFTVSGVATRGGNTGLIAFPVTGAGGWGTITHIGIYDALVVGNLLFHGALTTPRTVLEFDVFQFAIDDLGVTLT